MQLIAALHTVQLIAALHTVSAYVVPTKSIQEAS
jgi:hypothetical protein